MGRACTAFVLSGGAGLCALQADRIAELEGELAEAIECGAHFATALRWAVPDSTALLRA